MQVQKKERSLSRNLGEDAPHQKEVEDRFVFGDSGDEPRKDNQQEVERWCNAINLVPFEDVKELVKQQQVYLTQLNENPKHSDRTIKEWTKALEGQFETEELAKGYAISMLNQQAANSFADWAEFGDSVGMYIFAQLNVTPTEDYPEEMDDVIKDRVEKMIKFLDRRPNIRALGKRFELVHIIK
jgi:predicted Zn-dependent peptidase|tara:strand:- start:212 stop:763 length:552 start_codon:yes stop_codon:yes gene_type:complete